MLAWSYFWNSAWGGEKGRLLGQRHRRGFHPVRFRAARYHVFAFCLEERGTFFFFFFFKFGFVGGFLGGGGVDHTCGMWKFPDPDQTGAREPQPALQ